MGIRHNQNAKLMQEEKDKKGMSSSRSVVPLLWLRLARCELESLLDESKDIARGVIDRM